ncbi:MAG TPA: sugar ABC transporter substrate-binding protein [Bacillales bacterium]
MKKLLHLGVLAALSFCLVLAGCGGTSSTGGQGEGGSENVTLTVAVVNNPDMKIMEGLSSNFEKDTGIKLNFVTLPENELRKKVTEDVALGAGKFDVVMVSNYSAPIWAKNKWLEPLGSYFDNMSDSERKAYDLDDIFKPIKAGLSYNDELYALPFYGESSMLYYNKEMLKKANVEMPLHPTWQQVADIARKIHKQQNVPGIVLRGLPGWGQILAPLDTVINAFGGRWYDKEWNAKLTSPDTKKAVKFYVNLLKEAGQPGATSTGFTEALTLMSQGKAAMWYDATVAAGTLNNPDSSKVVGKIGYAYAPKAKKDNNGWLYSWALAIEKGSKHKDAAFKFITWATSKDYINLVGKEKGWVSAPPGTRKSTYNNPEYQKAAPFAKIVLNSIKNAEYKHPTVDPVPYQGIQFLAIPEFQKLGNEVSQQIAASIAGKKTVDQALQASQKIADKVAKEGGYKK